MSGITVARCVSLGSTSSAMKSSTSDGKSLFARWMMELTIVSWSSRRTRATRPKSSSPRRPSSMRNKFPGWGSAWNVPDSSSCTRNASCAMGVSALIVAGVAVDSFAPSIHSVTATRDVHRRSTA